MPHLFIANCLHKQNASNLTVGLEPNNYVRVASLHRDDVFEVC